MCTQFLWCKQVHLIGNNEINRESRLTSIHKIEWRILVDACLLVQYATLGSVYLTIPGVQSFLSQRICRDPLENFLWVSEAKRRYSQQSKCRGVSKEHSSIEGCAATEKD